MKQILIILGLFASVSTFAQSPRIKLNQITKDSLTGSVLVSSPTDSGMVYSRDLFISYGADTVLILGGDTIVLQSDLIAEIGDSLVNYVSRTELSDSLIFYASRTELSDSLTFYASKTELSDSTSNIRTDIPLIIADSLLNYVTVAGTQTITGAKTFSNTLTQSGGDVNFDSNTFFVDEDEDRVGIGTSTPSQKLTLTGPLSRMDFALRDIGSISTQNIFVYDENSYDNDLDTVDARFSIYVSNPNSTNFEGSNSDGPYFFMRGNGSSSSRGYMLFAAGDVSSPTGSDGQIQFLTGSSITMTIEADGDVVIPRVYTNTTGTAANVNVDATGLLRRFSSSIRYKTNIQSYDKGIDKVMSLNPVYYQGINDGNNLYAGFIAEQVDEIGLSEFIQYDLQGRADAISYANMTALLTKAIQEQQAIIESQSTEIETLKTLITELSNRLQILENK